MLWHASFVDFDGSPCCYLGGYGVTFFVLVPSYLPGSFVHLYVDSLWGTTYRPEQKTPTGFVSAFDINLITSAGVQNATDFSKVFLQRSLMILEENELRHQEAVQKIASLEVEVAK